MNSYALPPIAASVAGLAASLTRQLPALVLDLPGRAPTAETVTLYTMGARFATFVLVYGLVFGAAYLVERRSIAPSSHKTTALATGMLAATGYLIGAGFVHWQLGVGSQGPLATAALQSGSGIAVGIKLAVVAFAALSLARRRDTASARAEASEFSTPSARSGDRI